MSNVGHRLIRLSFCIVVFGLAPLVSAFASDAKCEPDKVIQKYRGLAGRTIKLAVTADTKPLGWRDPNDFDHIMGYSPGQGCAAANVSHA